MLAAIVLCGCDRDKVEAQGEPKTETKTAGKAAAPDVVPERSGVLGALQRAQVQSACVKMMSLTQEVEMYRIMKRSKCPTSVEALKAAGMVARVELDPWKKGYLIECSDEAITIRSGGLDGVLGNQDDLAAGTDTRGCGAPEPSPVSVETNP